MLCVRGRSSNVCFCRDAHILARMAFLGCLTAVLDGTPTHTHTFRLFCPKACEEAMESDRLAALLEKVLDIGNLLNEGTVVCTERGRKTKHRCMALGVTFYLSLP